ncbi:MAG: hypothetical protein A2V70_15725 [Planctomycetes bacterium RBG_13_63_9]|nr:MAG: hypothetical protein A2V70_15725 [Planctomycetes bacterium RBG_13_63_9]
MHLAETRDELDLLRSGSGPFRSLLDQLGAYDPQAIPPAARPLDYLHGLAAAHRALVIHGNYLDDEEIGFLGKNSQHMAVVYCPRSHAYFRHDRYPLEKMLSAGATMALGTDGRASSPDLSLLAEMRFVAGQYTAVDRQVILRLGTIEGAKALGRDQELGTLAPGKRADLAVVSLPNRHARDPHDLLFDSALPVAATYCEGKFVAGTFQSMPVQNKPFQSDP